MVTWNDEADAKILVGILKTAKPKIDYEVLAKFVGDGCTAYALQHRIRKIQAKAKAMGDLPDTPVATPTKASSAGKTPKSGKKATPSGKKRGKKAMDEDDSGDGAEEMSPTQKKAKVEKVEPLKFENPYEGEDDDEVGGEEYA